MWLSHEAHLGTTIQMDGGAFQGKREHSGMLLSGVKRWPWWGGEASRAGQFCPSHVPCQRTLQRSELGVSQGSPAEILGLSKAGSGLDCLSFLCKL